MPPPETTKLEIPEWTGSGLSNGDHLAYAKDLYNIYSKGDFAPLSLVELGQRLAPALESLNAAVNRQRAFDETNSVTAADATRDRIFYAMWYAWEYLSQLDQHHPLYVASNTLRSEMMKCKGAARFKLEAETEAISGLQTALANPTNGEALATLGLDKIAAALWEANEAVKTVMDTRNVERGERAEGRADRRRRRSRRRSAWSSSTSALPPSPRSTRRKTRSPRRKTGGTRPVASLQSNKLESINRPNGQQRKGKTK